MTYLLNLRADFLDVVDLEVRVQEEANSPELLGEVAVS